MKRILALLLTLVVVLSLAACGSEDDSSSRRSRRKGGSSEATGEETADTVAETEEQTEEPTEEETEPEEEEQIIGTISGNTYENEYFGIGVELDKSWVCATYEEAAELLGLTSKYMGVDDLMENAGVFCDLYAADTSGASVNIMIQEESFLTKRKDDQEYAQFALEGAMVGLEQAGFSNIQTEIGTMTFAGDTYCTVILVADLNGTTVYETMVVMRKNGYAVTITSASQTQDGQLAVLELFYKV